MDCVRDGDYAEQGDLTEDLDYEYEIEDDYDSDSEELDNDSFDDGEATVASSSQSILRSTGVGRVFIVSTARCTEGHRPAVALQGELYEVCMGEEDQGAFLKRVLHGEPSGSSGIDPEPLSLSLRYEPPSPKFSQMHPGLTSYRVKLLQGSQFIYLHRGLPKVCLVDRGARCLVWGDLQLVMRDTQQLNAVLAVLRHADVQHASVWPPQFSMLWLGRATDEQQVEMDEKEDQEWRQARRSVQGNSPPASSGRGVEEGGSKAIGAERSVMASPESSLGPAFRSRSSSSNGGDESIMGFALQALLSPTGLFVGASMALAAFVVWRRYSR